MCGTEQKRLFFSEKTKIPNNIIIDHLRAPITHTRSKRAKNIHILTQRKTAFVKTVKPED
jgi:hypothetical protein